MGANDSRLRLRPDLAMIPMDGGVQFRAGDEEIHTLRAEPVAAALSVLALLDGRHSRADIRDRLGAEHHDLLDAVLDELTRNGLLAGENAPADDDLIGRYLAHFPRAASPADLRACRVGLLGAPAAVVVLNRILGEHGISVRIVADPADLDCAVTACIWERPDLHWVEQVNQAATQTGTACLFVDLSHGRHATIGPFYVPSEGSCYRCFRHRLHQNTAAPAELRAADEHMRRTSEPLPAYGVLPAFRHHVAGIAANEIVAWHTRHRGLRTLNRIITVDFEGLTQWHEPAWRIPACPDCGRAPRRRDAVAGADAVRGPGRPTERHRS